MYKPYWYEKVRHIFEILQSNRCSVKYSCCCVWGCRCRPQQADVTMSPVRIEASVLTEGGMVGHHKDSTVFVVVVIMESTVRKVRIVWSIMVWTG